MKKIIFPFMLAMLLSVGSFAQTQIGADIDGDMADEKSGYAVSMPDANTMAIGTIETLNGRVRVYTWNGSAWTQKGLDIDGESVGNRFGWSLSMPDSNTVAVGAPYNSGSVGHVRVYTWNGTAWTQKGIDIDGEATNDRFGQSVSMPDANTLAVGAHLNDGTGVDAGHVRVYNWNGSAWIQMGADIDGEAAGDWSGYSVSMPDASTVAIGARYNDGVISNAGHVRVYTWNGTAWAQKGLDIDDLTVDDQSGYSVSMPDANTVAIGSPDDGNMAGAGHVKVYSWNGTSWVQKGLDIDGELVNDAFGTAVSMPDANTVAVGAPINSDNGSSAGSTRVYGWTGTAWVQRGADIDGEAADDESGSTVSMPDANTVAIGAPYNGGAGNNAGHVRVYDLSGITALIETKTIPNLQAYPNPNSGQLNIDLGETMSVEVRVYNSLGQLLKQQQYNNQNLIALDLEGAAGIYFVEIVAADGASSRLKVTKR